MTQIEKLRLRIKNAQSIKQAAISLPLVDAQELINEIQSLIDQISNNISLDQSTVEVDGGQFV